MEFLKSIFVIHRIDFHFYSVEVFCMFVMLHEHRMEQMRLESKYTFDRYYCNLITMYSKTLEYFIFAKRFIRFEIFGFCGCRRATVALLNKSIFNSSKHRYSLK